jgi:hypothetical protein
LLHGNGVNGYARWCEHGYSKAYEKTNEDLKYHFAQQANAGERATSSTGVMATATTDPHFRTVVEKVEQEEPLKDVTANFHDKLEKVAETLKEVVTENVRDENGLRVLATIPVTIDEIARDLLVLEGQNAEEAVIIFCRDNVPTDVQSCIRQLLQVVLDKMEELAAGDSAALTEAE